MSELLLELGTEELPAHAVRRAYGELSAKIGSLLIDEGILEPGATPVAMGTPRRLIVSFGDVKERQADSTKEQRGPGIKAAYDAEGKPTPALLGFCRGQGVDVNDLRQDGQYVWVTKEIKGRPAQEILSDLLPKAIRSLSFDKTMRWGASKMRFARPIRWILATLDGQIIPFEIEGVHASNKSRGHRFYAPQPFEASSLTSLIDGLRSNHVEPDPDRRREMIVDHLPVRAEDRPQLAESLIEENTFLTEWPTPIQGEFAADFLELPTAVLTTVMAKHEKMFPIKDEADKITNRFIFVRNSGEDDSVREGCEWVLNARMNDAKFFFEEDRRQSLEDFLLKTKEILFQEKLGTVLGRSERLAKLAPIVCPTPSESTEEAILAAQAGRLSKADLSSGLVSELASLQGIVGGIYAEREGLSEEVCWALSTQYDAGKNPNPDSGAGRTAVRLLIADQLDKLAGYLGIGLEPSGSSDPNGLRRSVSVLIEAAWGWPYQITPFSELFLIAADLYAPQGVTLNPEQGQAALCRLFIARYPALMPGVRHDVLSAALLEEKPQELTSPQSVRFRVNLMEALAEDPEFVQTATRPINIVGFAKKKGIAISSALMPDALQSETGVKLLERTREIASPLQEAIARRNLEESLTFLRTLQKPINSFFTETMVMAEDEALRGARLALSAQVAEMLLLAGDFTKLVFEGTA